MDQNNAELHNQILATVRKAIVEEDRRRDAEKKFPPIANAFAAMDRQFCSYHPLVSVHSARYVKD